MGLLDWTRKPKPVDRREKAFEVLLRAALTLREDLPDGEQLSIGKVAGKLATYVRVAANRNLADEAVAMGGGILSICAGHCMSIALMKTDASSGAASYLVFLKGDADRFRATWPAIKAEYERMTAQKHELIKRYDELLLNWVTVPGPDAVEALSAPFLRHVEAIESIEGFRRQVDGFRRAMETIGYTDEFKAQTISVAGAAGFLVRALCQAARPDRSDPCFAQRRALYAMSIGSYLGKLAMIRNNSPERMALVTVETPQERDAQTQDERKRFYAATTALFDMTNPWNDDVMAEIVRLAIAWADDPSQANFAAQVDLFSNYVSSVVD